MKQWKGEACTENIPVTADFLSEALEAGGCPPEIVVKYGIALDEVVDNIIIHGDAREIRITCSVGAGQVQVTVWDDGSAFDPTRQSDPLLTGGAEERALGGLGIYLVKKLMDEVSYSREGDANRLRLVKSLG